MKSIGTVQADILPDSIEWKNQDGDTLTVQPIKFRCQGCGMPQQSVVLPGTPVEAKFHCRRCDYVSTVKTRDPVMDIIEGHWDEAGHHIEAGKRTTNSTGAGQKKPGQVPAVIRGQLVYVTPNKAASRDD